MDDLMFRIRSQYVERIIWIVIILILLIALVVVSVYKTESCAPGGEEPEETAEEPAPEPEAPAPVTPRAEPTPAPKPEAPKDATLSGKATLSIDRLDCQAMSAAGNLTRGKINSVGITFENGKSDPITAKLAVYIWDVRNEDEKDVARTGEKPVLIGTIQPGKKFNDFVNVRNKPTSFTDIDREHYFKGDIVDDADAAVATKTVKFKMVGSTCQIV